MATTQSIYRKSSLAFIPRGAVDGVVPTIKPTDGSGDFTFSRGTGTATRVNASGLIEKERSNQILQSNTFDTTWTNALTTDTGGQADKDGGTSAWLLSLSGAGGRIQQTISKSGVQTLSVYAKAGTYDFIDVLALGSLARAGYFDLTNGVVGTTFNLIDSSIESVGGGWYRCSITFNDTISDVRFYPAVADNDLTGTSGNIYIQDAQLEQGLVATDYIETTTAAVYEGITDNLPRLDYSGGASCPSLKLESSRTNLVEYSEYFGGWANDNLTLSANNTTSPEGVQNAYSLIPTASNIIHRLRDIVSSDGSSSYTYSVFAKANGYDYLFFRENSQGGVTYANTFFNLASGTTSDTGASIEDFGNGWYRCILTTTSANTSITWGVGVSRDGSNTLFTGDGTSGVYLWGAQFELGSYPTSIIPTYGTAASRAQDFAEATFAEGTLSPNGNTTLFIEFESSGEVDTSPNTGGFYLKNNAGTLSHFGMSFGYGDRIYSNYQNGSTIQWDGTIQENTNHKVCFQFVQGGKSFLDGAERATTSVDWSTKAMGQLELQYGSKVKQAILFPTILTDAECIALTTI
jgi:hypothetical protein